MTSATEKPGGWYALDVDIDGAAHEAVEYALMEAGALGTETTDSGVTAYFAETPNRERVRNELFEALRIYERLGSPEAVSVRRDLARVKGESG